MSNDLTIANDNQRALVDPMVTTTAAGLSIRDHGDSMTTAEFASWIEQNIGGSVQDALEQAAFMLCCDVISQDIAKAPLRLRRRTSPTTSEIVMPREHHAAALLARRPNRRHTWPEYHEMSVYWACLTSNSYAAVFRDRFGDPLELVPLQTGRVQERIEGRDAFYEITAATQQEQALLGSMFLRLHERDVIHVRSRMLDGMDGYSTLVAGKKTLETGKTIDRFRENLFGEEGQTRGVFTRDKSIDDTMPDPAFQRLRSQFKVMMNKFRQQTEPILLEGGIDFKPISSKPIELEFAAQFSAQINATCRLLRVPPHKVFQMDGIKYENLETSEKMYVGDTLVPVCNRFEARYGSTLLNEDDQLDYFFEYDRDAMTLRDPARETERVIKTLERGAVQIDEARAKLGMNPLPNGQGKARLIPTNMTLIGEDGKVLIAGSSNPKPDASGKDETPKPADEPAKSLRLVQ